MLEHKTILLISPQLWSDMYISKHHYAIELAKRNNQVYFLNPVLDKRDTAIEIVPHDQIQNLHLVTFSSLIPYWFKFHLRRVFTIFLHYQVKRILRKIHQKIDIVWDFDCNNLYQNLDIFGATLKIFHPVDQSWHPLPASKKPDILFSVSNEILSFYSDQNIPKYFINHGISGTFLELAQTSMNQVQNYQPKQPLQAVYVGNLMILEINYPVILQSIKEHPKVQFHFYGPYSLSDKRYSEEIRSYLKELRNLPNVILHGLKDQTFIADVIKDVDLFFYCYEARPGYNADNSHKILEYLSTGKVIVGSTLKVYQKCDLFPQAACNEAWSELFSNTIQHISSLNKAEEQLKRIQFVRENTYAKHLEKIQSHLLQLS